ncbi:MAG: transcriptional repressor [Bacteroidales bacterium]|nr:transcriptional repressor [Bacteroidales bacterium]MDD3914561.1 transcriptional repressor [Bacteroidales bacterium]MDD4634455.1 transcriptional repressor [Bacteroidales bacterium]
MVKKVVNNYEYAKKIFTEYLNEHNLRKTAERFDILKYICNINRHFDVESLYVDMRYNKLIVSRSTLYNTIDLLVKCKLVNKYRFNDDLSEYELRKFSKNQHYHIMDTDTNKLIEFEDKRIDKIIKELEAKYSMNINACQFILYGRKKNQKDEK